MGKFEAPMLPGQETLNTTQRGQLSQLKILCYANSLGARTFESASPCETCFIFYSTFVTHPPCFNLLKNFSSVSLKWPEFLSHILRWKEAKARCCSKLWTFCCVRSLFGVSTHVLAVLDCRGNMRSEQCGRDKTEIDFTLLWSEIRRNKYVTINSPLLYRSDRNIKVEFFRKSEQVIMPPELIFQSKSRRSF